MSALDISLTLNGAVMQAANTAQLMFDVPTLVSRVSELVTLVPGDVILTGTPGGVGFRRDPQVFLAPGDRVVRRGQPARARSTTPSSPKPERRPARRLFAVGLNHLQRRADRDRLLLRRDLRQHGQRRTRQMTGEVAPRRARASPASQAATIDSCSSLPISQVRAAEPNRLVRR